MKKRIISMLLAAVMVISLLPATALAATTEVAAGECGENLTWTLDSEGTLTISGTGEMKNYTGYITAPWFKQRSAIKKAVIDSCVTSIGSYAFYYCENLTNITILNSITSIGQFAFKYCSNLEGINIPNSVSTIGNDAFSFCSKLANIILPDGMVSIGFETFMCCDSLESITIPASVTSIVGTAFEYCDKLTDVYYGGTEEQWNAITIGSGNECLTNATIHYNSNVSKVDEVKQYEAILTMFHTSICCNWTNADGENWEDIYDPDNACYILRRYEANRSLSEVGYMLIDLDENGQSELLISLIDVAESGSIYDMYTIDDGEIVHVISSGERDRYNLAVDCSINNSGSSGAAYSVDINYRLDKTDGRLAVNQAVIYDGWKDSKNPWFYATTDYYNEETYEINYEVLRPISESQALSYIDNFPENTSLELTTFDKYIPSANEHRLELYPGVKELTVATGAQLQVTCSLYYGDQLVTDWDQPGISIGDTDSLSFVRCDQVSDGYCLTVQAHEIGEAELIFYDNNSGATLTVPVHVVSDVGKDDYLRKEWIRQHMEYAISEEYQTEIVAGYRGRMNAVFDDIIEDEGIKFYDFTDKFIDFTNGKFEVSQSDMYELLLAELMYASLQENGIYELFEENYYQAYVDVMDTLFQGMSAAEDLIPDKELLDSMQELLAILKTMDKNSPGFADTANMLSSLIDKNFMPAKVVDNLRSGAAVTGLGIVFDGALEAYNTCTDILTYSYNSVAYSYTSGDFERVMYALADKVSNDFGPENFPELGEKDREINWEDFEKALRSFTASLRAQKKGKADELGQYAVKRMKEGAENFALDTIITVGIYGVESIISCVPILGQIQTAIGVLSLGKSAAELLTDIDEQSYRLDMLTKLYCISVALDSVVDDFAKELSEEYFWKSTAFDESVTLYKAAQLKALEYMIEYEKTLLSDSYRDRIIDGLLPDMSVVETAIELKEFEEQIRWYENAVRILEENRPTIRNIICHDSNLRYDPATDQIIGTYQNAQLYVVACPVSVTILSDTGEQIAYLSNNVCEVMPGHELYFQTVEMDENESIKLAFVPEGYQILIEGENDGEMDIFATDTVNAMTYSLDIPVTKEFVAEITDNEEGDLQIISNRIGELTFDGKVDVDDVLALLWNVLFPDDYPIEAEADFDGNGMVDVDDVLMLLWYVLFPDEYPI